MIRRPPRSTHCISSAASDVYKRQSQSSPGAPPESPKKLPESPQTFPGALQELPQMFQKLPRVSQRPPRGSECPKRSLEPVLGGPSALKCDACAQKLAVRNTATGATGAAGLPGLAEMVARSAARSPSPHVPGTRKTVVALTPSNETLATRYANHAFYHADMF